jgi:hypothetical protein
MREAGRILREADDKLLELERQHAAVQRQCTAAWVEKQALLDRYYEVLRTVLTLIDDCESGGTAEVILESLKKLLEDQRVESLQVKRGESFDARVHKAVDDMRAGSSRPAVVVDILQRGYIQNLQDGTSVVLRPAAVRLGEETPTTGEVKHES